jgi:hypothetical protein
MIFESRQKDALPAGVCEDKNEYGELARFHRWQITSQYGSGPDITRYLWKGLSYDGGSLAYEGRRTYSR